jgi:ribonuclease Z
LYKAKNEALEEENRRLMNLTKMLLSSPHFAPILNDLSSNPQQIMTPQSTHPAQQVQQIGHQRRPMMPPQTPQQHQLYSV